MKKNTRPKIDIFCYTDYRSYLEDAYHSLHEQDPKISYRYIQKKAGYSAQSNHFWQIIRGRVSFSQQAARKIGKAFNLQVREIRYLELLSSIDIATDDEERNEIASKIKLYAGYERRQTESQIRHEYYSEWYYSALRELVNLPEFIEDSKWIAGYLRPRITMARAEKGLKKLLEWGFLVRDEAGSLRQAVPQIGRIKDRTDRDSIARLAVRNYHRHMITLGLESIEAFAQSSRLVTGTTMSVSKNQEARVRTLTEEYFKQVETIVGEDEPVETLLRLNLQFFPLVDQKKRLNKTSKNRK